MLLSLRDLISRQSTCSPGPSPIPRPSLLDHSSINLPKNSKLNGLIQDLKSLLGTQGLTSDQIDIGSVRELMENYTSDEKEWSHLALHDPLRNYSRNGVININNNANLLILVWSPGKSSPIHDHANAHCVMKILKGELVEHLYKVPDCSGKMEQKGESILRRDEVGYISDDIGLHKIENPSNECSVSLHLYTPPYAMLYGCSMYEGGTGIKHHVDMSQFHSWQGEVVRK